MTNRRGRKASSALVACALAATALTGCQSDKDPNMPPTTTNPSQALELICGFVPKSDVAAMVGSAEFTASGTEIPERGTEVTWGTCFVKVPGNERNSVEVTVDSAQRNSTGWNLLRRVENPEPGWKTFPADNPTGYANAPYSSTAADGSKQVGAFATYLRGDWIISVRDYQPAKGRDPIADATGLTQSIATTLGLPETPSTPYASPTPG